MTPAFRCTLGVATFLLLAACTNSVAGSPTLTEQLTTWTQPGDDIAERAEASPEGTTPPTFPDTVEGYALSREWTETVRAFEGPDWSTIYEFPATMNGCDLQRFYVRWRAVNSEVVVESALVSTPAPDLIVLSDPVRGSTGWMSGYGCGQPAFRMHDAGEASTLTDVAVEVQQWEVSVG